MSAQSIESTDPTSTLTVDELIRRHAPGRALERAGRRRAEALGIFIADVDQYACAARPGAESVFRSVLSEGVDSATPGDRGE